MVMQSLSRPEHEASLPELLARRARGASDGRLALDVAGGVLGAVAAGLWQPPGWPTLVSAGCCFAAFGLWGIADRVLGERRASGDTAGIATALRVVRASAAATGVLAALGLLLTALGLALGTWIS